MIDLNLVEFKKFPGGELHITDQWLDQRFEDSVMARIQTSDDLMKLCLFTDAYKRVNGKIPNALILPYIPYARQDRVANSGEALSVKVFTNIINSLGYSQVVVLDPHSDVSTALIENVCVVPQWDIFAPHITESVDLISPDAGALKKIYKLNESVQSECVIRTATKHRDTKTGWITDTTIDGSPVNKTAVVVDDICDGGGTFVALGSVIREQYDRVILMVTHGIFSKGLDELSKYYDEIVSTDSWNMNLIQQGKLKVFSVESILCDDVETFTLV